MIRAVIAAAWLIAIIAQATGKGVLLHHHALIEGGTAGAPPLVLAIPVFLLAWQVMIGGMMLPASVPAIGVFEVAARSLSRPGRAVAGFLGAYALVWTVFGLFAFLGDVALHRTVDAMPSLAARPWLIQSGVVALAGAYQFVPLKRQSLAACRHPLPTLQPGDSVGQRMEPSGRIGFAAGRVEFSAGRIGFGAGLEHAIDCLGSSGALMLLMFAAGFANLWWMAALTGVMIYEVLGRHGQWAASAVGVALLGLAAGALLFGGLPGWGPG